MVEQCVILDYIHIGVMDYIKPAYCTEAQVSVSLEQIRICVLKSCTSSDLCGPGSSGRIGSMS